MRPESHTKPQEKRRPPRAEKSAVWNARFLLLVVCALLAAPASHAAGREYSASALQQVLAPQVAVGVSSKLSCLEARQVRAILSHCEKSQLIKLKKQLEKQLASSSAQIISADALPSLAAFFAPAHEYSSLPAHFAAQLSGVRFNRFLE